MRLRLANRLSSTLAGPVKAVVFPQLPYGGPDRSVSNSALACVILVTLVSGTAGCRQSTGPAPTPSPSPLVGDREVLKKNVSVDLEHYLPPLDHDRVEVAPPAGWRPLPRDNEYLARFYKHDRNALPRIEIRVEDGAFSMTTVTEDNVAEFAEEVAKQLGEAKAGSLLEPVLPMVINETPCARYVEALKLKMPSGLAPAERQRLLVLYGGRLYTIDLLVLPDTLKSSRDEAYAVCAGMRFLDVSSRPTVSDGTQPEKKDGKAGAASDDNS